MLISYSLLNEKGYQLYGVPLYSSSTKISSRFPADAETWGKMGG